MCLPEIGDIAGTAKVLLLPDSATASETGMTFNRGTGLVKIFPAKLLGGPSFIKMMKEIFPSIHFMATGGIMPDKNDIQNWLEDGAAAVGIGSNFSSKEIMESEDEGIHVEQIKQIKSCII